MGYTTNVCRKSQKQAMETLHWFSMPGIKLTHRSRMYENTALITWIAELDFLICGCFLKCSVLLFYRRLARNAVSPLWIWGVQFAIAFTVAYSLAFVLTLIFNCSPTEAYWKSFSLTYTTDYTCVNTTAINLLAGILSIISDLYSIILPCMMTRHLLLPPTQRLALYIIFSLGLLAVAASSVRTYWLYKVGHSSDVSTCIFYVFVWAQLELSLGMMCTALPSLRVVFREYLSEPLSKLKRSVNTTSRSHRLSDAEEMIIAHTGAIPDLEQCHRVHDTPKHTPKSSVTTTTSSFTYDDISSIEPVVDDSTRPASWTKDIPYLVRTPADYESYNLHNMEKYRQSVHARDFPRSTTERSSKSGKIEEKEKPNL